MQKANYFLSIDDDHARRVVSRWIFLGLFSLVAAGLFSVFLVLARTPVLQSLIPLVDFFRVALIVHVNLSVLVWLLAISAALWRLSSSSARPRWDAAAYWLAVAGTALIVITPFAGAAKPQMSNYVPVLEHPLFFAGLGLFVAGISTQVLRTWITHPRLSATLTGSDVLRVGIAFSTVIAAIAFISVVASWNDLPFDMSGQIYFEFLFWGGGHVIQFCYTLLMMIAWVVLAAASGNEIRLTPRLLLVFLLILCLPIITVPFLYIAHDVASPGHRLGFTELISAHCPASVM